MQEKHQVECSQQRDVNKRAQSRALTATLSAALCAMNHPETEGNSKDSYVALVHGRRCYPISFASNLSVHQRTRNVMQSPFREIRTLARVSESFWSPSNKAANASSDSASWKKIASPTINRQHHGYKLHLPNAASRVGFRPAVRPEASIAENPDSKRGVRTV